MLNWIIRFIRIRTVSKVGVIEFHLTDGHIQYAIIIFWEISNYSHTQISTLVHSEHCFKTICTLRSYDSYWCSVQYSVQISILIKNTYFQFGHILNIIWVISTNRLANNIIIEEKWGACAPSAPSIPPNDTYVHMCMYAIVSCHHVATKVHIGILLWVLIDGHHLYIVCVCMCTCITLFHCHCLGSYRQIVGYSLSADDHRVSEMIVG